MHDWSCGRAFFHEGLPLVYDLNNVRVEKDCDLDATEIARVADDLMSARDLAHRRISVDRDDVGRRLAPGFRDLGWQVDRHVIMVHSTEPDRVVDTGEVVEIDESRVWPAREKYLRTYEWCNDDDTAAQMHAAYRTWLRTGNGVDLAIVRNGEAVSFAVLWRIGDVAQIEDVATLEEHRNQGLSRAVVTRAIDLAYQGGADLVFLIADAEDWPRDFYARLGFKELSSNHHFLKTDLQ